MPEPVPPNRTEIEAVLKRMGIKGVDDAFVARCLELTAATHTTLATLPTVQDKGLEPSHVFAPPHQSR